MTLAGYPRWMVCRSLRHFGHCPLHHLERYRSTIFDALELLSFVCLLILFVSHFAAITEYRHSRQFGKLREEERNVRLEVMVFLHHLCLVLPTICAERFSLQVIRCGRRVSLSTYDIVVGDIVPLKNGGQVSIRLSIVIILWLELHNWSAGTCRWCPVCCKLIED